MAGRLDLRGHFDSDEDLGISRGHKNICITNRKSAINSFLHGHVEERARLLSAVILGS